MSAAHGRGRWMLSDVPDQSGRTAVVTGASGGLGLETANALAGRNATVVLACRDPDSAARAADRIRVSAGDADIRVVGLDLASLASVREAAAEIRATCPRIDLLINNAGVMQVPSHRRSADGFELTLATNHLGHFALTGLVLDRLLATPGSRIVTVSSLAHRRGVMDFDDLQTERNYKPGDAYDRSKLANLLFQRPGVLHSPGYARRLPLLERVWRRAAADGGGVPHLRTSAAPRRAGGRDDRPGRAPRHRLHRSVADVLAPRASRDGARPADAHLLARSEREAGGAANPARGARPVCAGRRLLRPRRGVPVHR
jgi:short chain dehydrogenase